MPRIIEDKFSRRVPQLDATSKTDLEKALTAAIVADANSVVGAGMCDLDRITEVKLVRIGTGASREWEARYWVSIPGTHTPESP